MLNSKQVLASTRRPTFVYAIIGIVGIVVIRLIGSISHRFLPVPDVKVLQEAVATSLYVWSLFSFRRKLEQKLRESEIWARTIVEFSPIFLAVHQGGKFRYVNRSGATLLGEDSAEELVGKPIAGYIHPAYRNLVRKRIESTEILEQAVPFVRQKLIRKDGKILDIESKALPFKFREQCATLVVVQDVTEQMRIHQELQSTKELLESFVENSIDSILVLDKDLNVLRTNKAFERMFGWDRQEVLGQAPAFIRNGIAEVAQLFADVLHGHGASAHEVRCQDRKGRFIYVDFTFSPIRDESNEVFAVAVVGRDVTERRINAENLLQSENLYRLITENMSDLITVLDAEGTIQYASPSHLKVLGYPAESYLGLRATDFIHKYDRDGIAEGINNLVQNKEPLRGEFRCQDSDGWVTLEARAVPVIGPGGRVETIVVASRDITERKQIEQALLEAESRYRSLVEQASLGVFIYQANQLSYVNPRFLDIFGLSEQEALTVNPLQFLSDEDAPLVLEDLLGEPQVGSRFSYRLKGRRQDKEEIVLQFYGSVLLDHGLPALLGMVEDITEQVLTQEMLAKSERLGAIGQLAAGVAHEIRNPLTAIKGFLQLLRPNVSEHDEAHVKIVLDELERINHIISELLYVSKPIVGKHAVKDLHRLLEDVKVLLGTQAILNNIDLVSCFMEDVPFIYGEEQQLKQVFLNVIKNAIEAMPKGGQIVLQTVRKDRERVLVLVRDEGCGISAEHIPKLGEPFYTTKEKGTGLGLMVSYRIIEAHQGVFTIQSEVNRGTTVAIELPLVSCGE